MSEQFYPVSLVGEQHFRDAVERCRTGDPVVIYHEFDNPYDDRALVVTNFAGEPIGYVPRDSFVQAAVHDESRGLFAGIKAVETGQRGFKQVVLDVALFDGTEPAFRVRRRSHTA